MHVDIALKSGKLTLENLNCDCAYNHAAPDMDIYIQRGLIDGCPDLIARRGLGKNVTLVADGNTYDIAAKQIERRLKGAGFSCRMCVLPGERIEPTPEMVERIVAASGVAHFMLSVGSGVITDLTRRAAFLASLPFAAFGTAASMDGYTSITSSMMEGGTKVSEYGNPAQLLMFDPSVLASAPLLMQASGVGDVFAKYNVLVDWKLGSAAAGETFCPLCAELLTKALDECSSNINDILKRTEKGVEALIESLILAGLTVLTVGNTRPVASVEHNIAHYWEMTHLAYGEPSPSHGISAGIGLIYALLMHDILRVADLSKIDEKKVRKSRMSREEKESFIKSCYPNDTGKDIIEENSDWYIEWPEQKRRIDSLTAYHEQYKKDCEVLPCYKDVIRILEQFGAPASASKAGIDISRLEKALLCAKDFRARYSVAHAISELGMLEESVDKILEMEKDL